MEYVSLLGASYKEVENLVSGQYNQEVFVEATFVVPNISVLNLKTTTEISFLFNQRTLTERLLSSFLVICVLLNEKDKFLYPL